MKNISKRLIIIFTLTFIFLTTASVVLSELLASDDESENRTSNDYDRVLKEMRKELGNDFLYAKTKPFVVAGNLSRNQFDRIVNGTIERCYNAFYNEFFDKKPKNAIKVYLFKDDKTYRYYAKKLFNDEPTTPFGYYKNRSRTLVMNIGTGTGTLVHEMTHALIASDFPKIPDWFNEGFASLFEQCIVREGKIRGLKNWRLPILKKAIRQRSFVHLETLCEMNAEQFYGDTRGINYAVARYFCMYMQEKNLLQKFYKDFRDNVKQDPTGKKTIEKIFGKSINQIEREWLQWVKEL